MRARAGDGIAGRKGSRKRKVERRAGFGLVGMVGMAGGRDQVKCLSGFLLPSPSTWRHRFSISLLQPSSLLRAAQKILRASWHTLFADRYARVKERRGAPPERLDLGLAAEGAEAGDDHLLDVHGGATIPPRAMALPEGQARHTTTTAVVPEKVQPQSGQEQTPTPWGDEEDEEGNPAEAESARKGGKRTPPLFFFCFVPPFFAPF